MSVTRRDFVSTTGNALFAVACAPALLAQRNDHDLVIRGGTLFDGTGAEGRELDIALTNGRIAPFQYPVGISVVVVNGAVTLRDGQRSATGSGMALRVSG